MAIACHRHELFEESLQEQLESMYRDTGGRQGASSAGADGAAAAGGRDAVQAPDDPAIVFERLIDPDARAIRKWHDEFIEPLETSGAHRIGGAKFDIERKSSYPDATFTPRMSYGAVEGWDESRRRVEPFTNFAGAFDRATGRDPFEAAGELDRRQPHTFCHSHPNQLRPLV
jgi:hypothetical protein